MTKRAATGISTKVSEPARRADVRMSEIDTLLFDFGGTLDADGVAWKERFHKLYGVEGLDMSADTFEPLFFAADSSLIGRLPPETDLSETVSALAAKLETKLARHSGRRSKSVIANGGNNGDRGVRVASRFLSEAAAAFARNRPVLGVLRERYRLGIVSNFYGNLEAVCRGAGLASLFAVMVDSQRVGAEKPDPAIFHAALKTLRSTPERTAFVGDSLRRDREGARRMGMRFIWIAPKDVQTAEVQARGDPAEDTVTELGDLLKILK
jgi:FMN hydrolase / 5-amino-6-(5-phospho-D-ribitylamino)uracil phosphatase